AVIEDVYQVRTFRLALQAQRIEKVARGIALRAAQWPGQDDARRVDGLRPPAHECARAALPSTAAAVVDLLRERPDVRREPHVEPGTRALEPVVEAMGVLVHRGPALEGEVGDEKDSAHEGLTNQATPELQRSLRHRIV